MLLPYLWEGLTLVECDGCPCIESGGEWCCFCHLNHYDTTAAPDHGSLEQEPPR